MSNDTKSTAPLRVSALNANGDTPFSLQPDPPACAEIAERLGVLTVRKLRFAGTVSPDTNKEWVLSANLGATVVQSCVVSLEPVTTRIEEPVTRRFTKDWIGVDLDADEVEMPQDDTLEPLGEEIDLHTLMIEALALALPAYPRAASASLAQTQFAPPGVAPLSDADAKPFAALAALKDKLGDPDQDP